MIVYCEQLHKISPCQLSPRHRELSTTHSFDSGAQSDRYVVAEKTKSILLVKPNSKFKRTIAIVTILGNRSQRMSYDRRDSLTSGL